MGVKTWKMQTTGGTFVNVMDEAFLQLLLMNNAELWLWEWNKREGRLSEEEAATPPKRMYTVKSNKTREEREKARDSGDKVKGSKNTGWSDEGKKKLKDMAIAFHNRRKEVAEMEDPLDRSMNEKLEKMRMSSGKGSLSSAVQSTEQTTEKELVAEDEELNGFGLYDLQGGDGMEAV